MSNVATELSRRTVLGTGGALIVNFALAGRLTAQEASVGVGHGPSASPLPGSLKTTPMLDAWIKIGSDGGITVFTGKSELGQGIKTALAQVAAEQLGVSFEAIKLVTSDTDLTPDEVYTAGSQSMQDSGTAILHAAAQARELLIATAATRLGLQAGELKAEEGAVVAPDGRRLRYGELVADTVLHVEAQPAVASRLRAPEAFKVMGHTVLRVDVPNKVTGGAAYVQDMRLKDLVHARIVRPPSYGAQLRSVDATGVERMHGVKKVVRDGNFLAVIADGEFRAIKAMEALTAAARWDERETMPDPASYFGWLKQQPSKTIIIRDAQSSTTAPAVRTLEEEYLRPHQMHGSIGPSCGLAHFVDDRLTVWSHGQGMFPLRAAVAQLVKLPPEKVRCIHVEGSGCYGHNGADDAAADAAYLAAVHYPGVPVRVQWMRNQEHGWEPYGPGMVMRARASLDASGRIVAWDYNVWSDTHSTRPGGAGSTLVGQHIAASFSPPPPSPGSQPTGFGDRNIIPLYQVPNMRLVYNFVPHQKVRVSALRSLGAYANVFAIESFMDELAKAADVDPVAFRLRHLGDPRAQAVIELAAEKFGWTRKPIGGRGRGFAFAKYKNLAAYCAIAIELEVEHETGRVRLLRAVSAVDSGQVVNPDGLKNQIEGAIVQSASWTIHEMVAFDRTRINSRDWSTYPILRFSDVFDSVEVHVINRPGQPFLGTGEAAQGPAAAAIANALADATGQRMRELPFTRRRVKSAIGV